jgi:hypothetical protein
MGKDAVGELGSDCAAATASSCWLCDCLSGELCHVHESHESADTEPAPVVLTLNDGDQ